MGFSEQEFQSTKDLVKHQSHSFGPELYLKFKEHKEKIHYEVKFK